MAAATNVQVQNFSDFRVRPHSLLAVQLFNSFTDDKNTIGDVYANLTNSPTWTDGRSDGVPHLNAPADLLAYNAFITDCLAFMSGHASWPVIREMLINPIA